MLHLLALERNPRNKALLRLLYLGGLRISELCALCGRDLAARDDAGQVTLFGKGGKTRAVLLKPSIWQELVALRAEDPDAPVFRSRQGGALDPSQVHRIVKQAAQRAGLPDAYRRTGCATPMSATRSTAAPPSTSCRPPSATPASPPPAATPTPGPTIVLRATCRGEPVRRGRVVLGQHHRSGLPRLGRTAEPCRRAAQCATVVLIVDLPAVRICEDQRLRARKARRSWRRAHMPSRRHPHRRHPGIPIMPS